MKKKTAPDQPVAPPPARAVEHAAIFHTLFDASPDALVVADASGAIVLANRQAAELLGYTIDELVGLPVDALVPDAIRPRHAAYREAYGRNPRPRPMGNQMDLVAKRRDGSEVTVEIALSPLHDGGVPLVVAAIRDVGAYPRIKQALQRARYAEFVARLGRVAVDARDPQVLLEHLPAITAEALQAEVVAVFLLEPNRREFRVAAAVGEVEGEAVGMRVPNRPDSSLGFVVDHGKPLIVDDYALETRFRVPRAYLDAGLTSALAVPLSDRGTSIGVLVVRARQRQRFGADELRFLESLANLLAASLQRAQSEEALSHAQRLESVGQLTGGIAHDFNNLLTVIQGNLQVLEELPAIAADGYGQQLVGAAMRASRRGAELTSKLLAFSRRQVLQPSAVDVALLLDSLADMLRRTVDQRIVIGVEMAGPCPPVLADPGQLESALLNIAINARDAMPDGGTLCFRAGLAGALPAEVRGELGDRGARDDGFVAIAIADSGVGMSDAVKERAFEPFFTTKEAGRGTGLGLSTVYGFVKQSRGTIAIDSAPGRGTTVTLYLPRLWAPAAGAADDAAAGDRVPPGLRVLLVEDDPAVRAVAKGFLEALGCRVTEAASAEHALLALGPEAPFDFLLSDIALGAGMRGTQLAAQVQKRFAQLPVLLMSGYSSELPGGEAELPLARELLRKPFSRDELARAIARVLAACDDGAD